MAKWILLMAMLLPGCYSTTVWQTDIKAAVNPYRQNIVDRVEISASLKKIW